MTGIRRLGVEEGRGGVEAWPLAPFPFPAHQTGRADFEAACRGRGCCVGVAFPLKRKFRLFFLVNTTGARVLHRFSDPATPWPSCQRSPAVQKRPRRPANSRVASRCVASRRIGGCGALAFCLASASVPSRSTNFLPRRQNGVARKWRRNGLKRLNPLPEMVWARKPGSHNIWYTGARLTMRSGRSRKNVVEFDARGRKEIFRLAKH
jgi:hypothetical protein